MGRVRRTRGHHHIELLPADKIFGSAYGYGIPADSRIGNEYVGIDPERPPFLPTDILLSDCGLRNLVFPAYTHQTLVEAMGLQNRRFYNTNRCGNFSGKGVVRSEIFPTPHCDHNGFPAELG